MSWSDKLRTLPVESPGRSLGICYSICAIPIGYIAVHVLPLFIKGLSPISCALGSLMLSHLLSTPLFIKWKKWAQTSQDEAH